MQSVAPIPSAHHNKFMQRHKGKNDELPTHTADRHALEHWTALNDSSSAGESNHVPSSDQPQRWKSGEKHGQALLLLREVIWQLDPVVG